MKENPSFLKEQIITYLGNKRALLGFLNKGFKVAKKELGKDKFSFCDIFSGSGV
ncbi:UNVERIFIED_CONTAM: DNA modification methylase, partial [Campylobacter jejuni]